MTKNEMASQWLCGQIQIVKAFWRYKNYLNCTSRMLNIWYMYVTVKFDQEAIFETEKMKKKKWKEYWTEKKEHEKKQTSEKIMLKEYNYVNVKMCIEIVKIKNKWKDVAKSHHKISRKGA